MITTSIVPTEFEHQILQNTQENRSSSESSLSEPEEQLTEEFQNTLTLKSNANAEIADSIIARDSGSNLLKTRDFEEERKLTPINGPTFDYTESGRNWHGVC